jgi:hypothetical protein
LFLAAFLAACSSCGEQPYTDDGRRFSVLFPGTPEYKNIPDSPLGDQAWALKVDDLVYGVMLSTLPGVGKDPTTMDARLNAGAEQLGRALGGKVINTRVIYLGDRPGREASVELDEGKGLYRMRLFFSGDDLYQIIVAGPREKASTKVADKFLESFKIL